MFKKISRGISAFLAILVAALVYMPMTEKELAALDANAPRYNLVQMRVARTMMDVAPELTVAAYARATEMPPEVIHDFLTAKANGQPIGTATAQAETDQIDNQRTVGGAKFVRID